MDLCGHVLQWGPYFEQRLKELKDLAIVGDVRGSHFMLSLELVANKSTKDPFDAGLNIAKRVYYHARSMGLIIRPIGSLIVLSPPLTYDKAAIDTTCAVLRKSIEQTMYDLKKEALWKEHVKEPGLK